MHEFAVVLNGCGHRDGSEVQESVCAFLGLERRNIKYSCYSLDEVQQTTYNHYTGEKVDGGDKRNLISEAARLSRGKIKPLNQLDIDSIDGLLIPGGFGAALNLSDYAEKGGDMRVHAELAELLVGCFNKKVIGAICLAPILLARVLGEQGVRITLGELGSGPVEHARNWGADVVACSVESCVIDKKYKVVTTPAYMYGDASLKQVSHGIDSLCENMLMLV